MRSHYFNGTHGLLIAVFSLGLVMSGCKPSADHKPIMEEEKFVNLLVEIYIAEARLASYPIERDSAIKLFIPFEDQLLEKYAISDSLLKETYRYYIDHPDEFDKIYDIVVDSLNLRHQKLEAVRN
ncbi:MAG: DUF4296 domain-containing protein [Flammeovirgaceae bacterium]|nr:DUF4296 domain-containing protein [Flammeovirgaceae bacterium]